MPRIAEHVDVWYRYLKANVNPEAERPEIRAGREAEDLLRNIVQEHYQFKGCHSYAGKRIFNPEKNYKNEIDLIIVTEKKLYILECKNWSGRLKQEGDQWIQYRRNKEGSYRTTSHDDVVVKNEAKRQLILYFLRAKGIDIAHKDCVQKIIFMNKNLAIDSEEIYKNPCVIPPDKLDTYLGGEETRLKLHQRFFASVINLLLDDESSAKIVDGLFKKLGGKDYNQLLDLISGLPTWDKVVLYGTRIISGDIRETGRSIFKETDAAILGDTKQIKVGIIRSKPLFLLKSLLAIGRPIPLDLYGAGGKLLAAAEGHPDGMVKIQPAGSPDCIDIPIFNITTIIFGK